MLSKLKSLVRKVSAPASSAAAPPRAHLVGEWGEDQAAHFLQQNGFKILGRNVRPARHDEIDMIAIKGQLLIFVEVKTRKHGHIVRPLRAVDQRKRHALNRAAATWLRKAGYPYYFYRFDVVEVIGQPEDNSPEICHIEDAFPFESRFRFPVYKKKQNKSFSIDNRHKL